MVESRPIAEDRQITAAPMPTAMATPTALSSEPKGPFASITLAMPTIAPQLMQTAAVVAPFVPPPDWKWQPQAMNDTHTNPATRVVESGPKKSQVSSTASRPTEVASARY